VDGSSWGIVLWLLETMLQGKAVIMEADFGIAPASIPTSHLSESSTPMHGTHLNLGRMPISSNQLATRIRIIYLCLVG
jgi:hypothetical protein